MPVPQRIGGRRIALAIDEEDQAQSASEEEARRGRAHACILTFDVSDPGDIKPLGQFQVSELDSPFSRSPGARFGAHQFCERMTGTLVYAVWFGGGLRIIDVADPLAPREVGYFIPEPVAGRKAPQSNDVDARRPRADLHGRPQCRLRRAGIWRLTGAPHSRCRPRVGDPYVPAIQRRVRRPINAGV